MFSRIAISSEYPFVSQATPTTMTEDQSLGRRTRTCEEFQVPLGDLCACVLVTKISKLSCGKDSETHVHAALG